VLFIISPIGAMKTLVGLYERTLNEMRCPRALLIIGLITVLLGSVPLLGGCGGGGRDSGDSSDGGAACESIGFAASLKVAGGEQCIANSSSDSSSIVKLTIETLTGEVATCTGTVISPNAVLTAGHCFILFDSPRVTITAVVRGNKVDIPAARVTVHPGFSISSERVLFNDVAIVKAASAIPVPALPILLSRAPEVGEESVVAGYGQTENNGSAVSDVVAGEAVIRLVTDNHLRIDYQSGESHPCKGDSGGALLVYQADGLAVVGVVSQSDPSVSSNVVCEKGDKTLYINTQQPSVSNFIFSQARGAAVK
jgi:secreted trypsin-like serine protease